MKGILASALLLAAPAIHSAHAAYPNVASADSSSMTDSISQIMRHEADSFISGITGSRNQTWIEAIDSAIAGDSSRLSLVRNSRNTAPALPDGVTADTIAKGIVLFRTSRLATEALPILIYLHGGGWTVGSVSSCTRYCAAVASTGKAMVAAIEYPLAPEHPYPEALAFITNCIDTIHSCAEELGSAKSLVSIGGDSSGGNLAIASAMLRPHKMRSMVLFYPVTYAGNDNSQSWIEYGSVPALEATLMDAFNRAYRPEEMKEDPLVSPILASDKELEKLPPTLIIGAERDILRDQGSKFASRLTQQGVTVKHIILPATTHLFITVPGQSSAFSTAVNHTLEFLANPMAD